MTIVIAGTVALFTLTYAMRQIGENQVRLMANIAMTSQMETLRSQTFAQIAALAPSTPFNLGALPTATGMIYVCDFNPATSVCDGGGRTNIKLVTVTVSMGSSMLAHAVGLFSAVSGP